MKTKSIAVFLSSVLVLVLLFGCGAGLSGTYTSDSVNITLKFTGSNEYTWHELGMVFNGSYEKTDDGLLFTTQGSGIYPTQEFVGYMDGDDLILTVYRAERRFVKES